MKHSGNLRKMATAFGDPVTYTLHLGDDAVAMNDLIGKEIQLHFGGQINCMSCGNTVKKAFAQGFCYNCFTTSPMASECIIRPELCQGHEGKGRDADWEAKHHVQPHIVYLAVASGIKVGVTRVDQIPTRWIDQGAWKAIELARVPYRKLAGDIEVSLKAHISDKTHWQKMLKNVLAEDIDPEEQKFALGELLPRELQKYLSDDDEVWEINYPVTAFPETVKSQKLDKVPLLTGTLMGIKGQYLIFDGGRVMNVRSHSGYFVDLEY